MPDHDAGALPPPATPPDSGPGAPGAGGEPPWWRRRVLVLPMWAWGVVGAVAVAGGARLLLAGDQAAPDAGDVEVTVVPTVQRAQPQGSGPLGTFDPDASGAPGDSVPDATATPAGTVPPSTATTTAATTTAPTTTAPTTNAPTTTAPTTTAPTTTAPTTTAPTTTAPTTTAPTTTAPTTTAPTTTAPTTTAPTTTVPPDGPFVAIDPRREPCRYGPDCLVAGFAISGFDHPPTNFVCEFSSGARYVFRFDSLAVDLACSTADTPDTITIEIDGVRSTTVTTADVGR